VFMFFRKLDYRTLQKYDICSHSSDNRYLVTVALKLSSFARKQIYYRFILELS
jgi:hypothetical protein